MMQVTPHDVVGPMPRRAGDEFNAIVLVRGQKAPYPVLRLRLIAVRDNRLIAEEVR